MDRKLLLHSILLGCISLDLIINVQEELTLFKVTNTVLTVTSLVITGTLMYMSLRIKTVTTQTEPEPNPDIPLARHEDIESDNESLFSSMLLRRFLDTSFYLENSDTEV